jgi:hypothetical protein
MYNKIKDINRGLIIIEGYIIKYIIKEYTYNKG